MSCPACGHRKPRRACPALSQTICAVCCGTKRLVEIACPPGCAYLATARDHPAAVVRRQQERDVARLLPTLKHLSERQYQLFFLFHSVIAQHRPEGFARLVDADVADAAGALAATLEIAARGVLYEHPPGSAVAQGLTGALRGLLERAHEQGATIPNGEAAVVLRAIEGGARTGGEGGESAYLDLMARLLQVGRSPATPDRPADAARSLIVP